MPSIKSNSIHRGHVKSTDPTRGPTCDPTRDPTGDPTWVELIRDLNNRDPTWVRTRCYILAIPPRLLTN